VKKMIIRRIEESVDIKKKILNDQQQISLIENSAQMIIDTLRDGGKVLTCGNGGSAADAQHIAAELQGKFYMQRGSLSAIALTTNTSAITAISNDYGFSEAFVRQLQGVGSSGDILIGISTSGNSLNVIRAFEEARRIGLKRIAFTGETGGQLGSLSDICINVPSKDTPRIQEAHILIGHIICELVELELFG